MHAPLLRSAFAAVVCLGFASIPNAHATSITVTPSSQDTFIREDAVNTVPGGGNSWRIKLHSRAARRWRGLVQFDLSQIPQFSTINSAQIRLRETGAALDATKTHGVFVISGSWLQSTAKWSNQ